MPLPSSVTLIGLGWTGQTEAESHLLVDGDGGGREGMKEEIEGDGRREKATGGCDLRVSDCGTIFEKAREQAGRRNFRPLLGGTEQRWRWPRAF